MPLTPIRINSKSQRDLLAICEQSNESLISVYNQLVALKDDIISPSVLRLAIEKSISEGVARVLVTQLIGMRQYIETYNVTAGEAVNALTLGVYNIESWSEEDKKKWEKAAPIFEKILQIDSVITTSKALELSYDFEHLLSSAKIITDIRPVYSVDRSKIIGGIVCNKLRLRIHEEDSHKGLSISIDVDEIRQLKTACDEALRKIELASSMLKQANKSSFIIGEENNELN